MPGSASARSRSWPSDRAVDGGPGDRSVAKRIVRRHSGLAIAFVALRSPRRGRVARRSPSIAIVGRRLLGRFLLGDCASQMATPASCGQLLLLALALAFKRIAASDRRVQLLGRDPG